MIRRTPLRQQKTTGLLPFVRTQASPRHVILTLFIVMMMAGLYVYQQLEIVRAAQVIQQLGHDRDRLQNLNEFTRADIDEMSRFSYIESTARETLDMDFPADAPSTLVIIPPDANQGLLAATLDAVLPNLFGASR
jgi:cell division protein FtsL